MAAPELNSPALKKYGLSRPDLSLKLPNFSTPSRMHKSMNSRLIGQGHSGGSLARDTPRRKRRAERSRPSEAAQWPLPPGIIARDAHHPRPRPFLS